MGKKDKKTQSFTHENLEKNLYLRITEYGVKHSSGFIYGDFINDKKLNLKTDEKSIVGKYFHSAYVNARETKEMGRSGNTETPFLLVGNPSRNGDHSDNSNKYTLSFDANFKYIDYLELKFARENATQARTLSLIAIIISIITIIVSVTIPFFFPQTIKLQKDQILNISDEIFDNIKTKTKD